MFAGCGGKSDNADTSGPVTGQSTPATKADASRFLAQATFGPTRTAIDGLMQSDYGAWIDSQMALPASDMRANFDARQAAEPSSAPSRDWLFTGFWRHAVTGEDQLRQRVAFALSQIFVISLREGGVANSPRGAADYYSMLERNAFGNFRTLLEEVTLHPMMGAYLSHLGNEKGDELTGRVPDENFAREVMQLFSIGLYQLNPDGSVQRDASGAPMETYTNDDVQGLARVFTGFSWHGPDQQTGRFQGWIADPERAVQPMQAYPQFHSTREKKFLGVTIAASSVPDPLADLSVALDTLFNHPNTGPFIARQLIQRLVTSNPAPAYISRVTDAFNDNGAGERGDMSAVIRAVLLDPQARDLSQVDARIAGKVREPILRLTHWMRSFQAQSASGNFELLGTDDPATSLGMTPLRSPSVFNFYRPGYVPPNSPIAANGLVAPEMQITHQTSVAGYLNYLLNAVLLGVGSANDVRSDYSHGKTLASDPDALTDYIDLMLLHGSMSEQLRGQIKAGIALIDLPEAPATARDAALTHRARIAVYLVMSSPQYIVLK